MVMHHSILVVQERQQRVFRVQQHLALPFLLCLSRRVCALLQGQNLSTGQSTEVMTSIDHIVKHPQVLNTLISKVVKSRL